MRNSPLPARESPLWALVSPSEKWPSTSPCHQHLPRRGSPEGETETGGELQPLLFSESVQPGSLITYCIRHAGSALTLHPCSDSRRGRATESFLVCRWGN